MTKVKLELLKPWITRRITNILGFEDEVVISLLFNMLETTKNPDPKDIQINLTGFLESNTKEFMSELWTMLLSAQTNPLGIPQQLLDEKKAELMKGQVRKSYTNYNTEYHFTSCSILSFFLLAIRSSRLLHCICICMFHYFVDANVLQHVLQSCF